jgi:hypothetical protein
MFSHAARNISQAPIFSKFIFESRDIDLRLLDGWPGGACSVCFLAGETRWEDTTCGSVARKSDERVPRSRVLRAGVFVFSDAEGFAALLRPETSQGLAVE